MLLTGADVASTGTELRHADSAPPGTLPPVAPSLPAVSTDARITGCFVCC